MIFRSHLTLDFTRDFLIGFDRFFLPPPWIRLPSLPHPDPSI